MISSHTAPARPVAASTASPRTPYVDGPPADAVGPDERHDAGWLGQVPPPAERDVAKPPARRSSLEPGCGVEDLLTGSNALRDREAAGWLGQVPPPASHCELPGKTPPRDELDRPTDFPTSDRAHEEGWLGQVPPPPRPEEPAAPREPEPEYAIPGLAPDPWLDPGTLYPSDPTLFG